MHFVSSSMLKEAEHQLLQAQVWRSLKFAFGPLASVVQRRRGAAGSGGAAVAGARAAYTAGGGSG